MVTQTGVEIDNTTELYMDLALLLIPVAIYRSAVLYK